MKKIFKESHVPTPSRNLSTEVISNRSSGFTFWAGLFFLALSVSSLSYYVFENYKNSFHSDAATKVLLAEKMLESGNFFPSGFYYGNGELWVVSMQLLVLPFLLFLPAGYLAHAFGATLNFGILLFVSYKFQGEFIHDRSIRFFVTGMLATGLSLNGAENLYGQYAYSMNLVLVMVYLIFTSRLLGASNNLTRKIFPTLLLVWLIVFLMSVQSVSRTLIYLLIPLFISMYFIYTGKFARQLGRQKILWLLTVNISAVGFGLVARTFLGSNLNIAEPLSVGFLLDPSQWRSSFIKSIENFTLLFGAEGFGDLPLFSGNGFLTAVKYLFALAIPIAIGIGLANLRRVQEPKSRFFFFFTLITLVVTMLATSMTSLSENRYWQVAAALAFIVGVSNFVGKKNRQFPLFFLLSSLLIVFNSFTITAPPQFDSGTRAGDSSLKLIEYLKSKELTLGYASYWNASKYTILSENQVAIRPVHILGNAVLPFRWLSFEDWYQGSGAQKSFLLLTEEESQSLLEEELSTLGITPSAREMFNELTIFVFDFDIADRLTGWDPAFTNGDVWPVTPSTFTKIGTLTESDSNGLNRPCLATRRGDYGLVHFGPYVSIAPGTYTAKFEISTSEPTSERTYIEVTYNGGRGTLGKQPLDSTLSVQEIEFKVESFTEGLELIYYSGGESDSLFCGVSLKSK